MTTLMSTLFFRSTRPTRFKSVRVLLTWARRPIAQVRAAENGRWLLRATNNGVTAIVDHRGRRVAELPQFEAGVLRGELQVREGRTPYSRLGDWPVLFVLAAGVFVFASRRVTQSGS